MALYTNVSARLIMLSDGTSLIPGASVEVSDEMADNQTFQDFVKFGDIKAGAAPTSEEMVKLQQERMDNAQHELEHAQQPQEQNESKPNPQPQEQTESKSNPQVTVQRTTTVNTTKG